MNQLPKMDKRIVSKGTYAKAQAMRVGSVAFGLSLLALAVCCGFATVALVWTGPFCLIFAGVTYLCGKTSVGFLYDAQLLGEVKPLTRANTAGLPAPESLVRASAEPRQEQQGVLLRAATETQDRQVEELVRASAEAISVENIAVTYSTV